MAGSRDLYNIVVKMEADYQKLSAGLKRARSDIKRFHNDTNKSMGSVRKNVAGLADGFRGLATAAGAYFSIRGAIALVRQADDFKTLQVRIKTATKATGDYADVSRELYQISQNTGAALGATVAAFQDIARAAPGLGATNKQVLEVVKAVEQLGVIGGSTPTQLATGFLQLSQGLASGVLHAQDFRSVLVNLPEVAERIAKGMGKTVGELQKSVLEGKVLSKDIFDSLAKQAPEIAEEFKDIPDSVARSATTLDTAFSSFLSKLDSAISGTQTLAGLFKDASRALDLVSGNADVDTLIARRNQLMKQYQDRISAGLRQDSLDVVRLKESIADLDKQIIANQKRQGGLLGLSDQGNKNTVQTVEVKVPEASVTYVDHSKVVAEHIKEIWDSVSYSQDVATRQAEDYLYVIDKIRTPVEKLGDEYERIARVFNQENSPLSADQFEAAINKTQVDFAALVKTSEESADAFSEAWINTTDRFASGIGDAFANAIVDGKNFAESMRNVFKDVAKQIISTIIEIGIKNAISAKIAESTMAQVIVTGSAAAAQLAAAWTPAATLVSLGTAGVNATGAQTGIATTFALTNSLAAAGLAREQGGPVAGGQTYLVGEKGPELFSPGRSGYITPNHQLSSGAPIVHIHLHDVADSDGFDRVLVNRRALIANMLNQALRAKGKREVF